jgi:hypothetical protein
MSDPVPNFGEARKAVASIIGSEDPYDKACVFAEGSSDPSILKIAEYALLVPIVKQGMVEYLDGDAASESIECLKPVELQEGIGNELADRTVEAFEQHPHRPLINQFAARRAELVSYGAVIFPVEGTLRGASTFASSAMVGVALASGFAINREMPHTQRPRGQFIEAVKNSHQPALARSVMHMLWNDTINNEVFEYVQGSMLGRAKVNQEALVYDRSLDCAVLAKPLTRWLVSDDLREIGDIAVDDTRVGCPFSFEPELLKGFYEHVVDVMELKQCWPELIADRGAVRDMRHLASLATQSKLGMTE